jgi:plastocyanin
MDLSVPPRNVMSQIRDKNWSVTFTKPGTYTYVCLLHPAQVGTVIVHPA